jgi:hypothetical protein
MKKAIIWIFGLFAVVVLISYFGTSHKEEPSPPSSYPRPTEPQRLLPSDIFEVKVNRFSSDEYNYYQVVGEVKNISPYPFKFVEVKAHFLDKENNIVGEDTTYACSTDFIMPGATKSFKFMGENQSNYKSVHVEVIDYTKVD